MDEDVAEERRRPAKPRRDPDALADLKVLRERLDRLPLKRTLTTRRVDRLARKPFSCNELIGPLAKEEPVYQSVYQELRDWYLKTLEIVKLGTAPAGGDGGARRRQARQEEKVRWPHCVRDF